MGCFVDLTNMNFGYLHVLNITNERDSSGSIIWECECKCGNICYVSTSKLNSKHTTSCGCKNYEPFSEIRKQKISAHNKIHGQSYTKLYNVWNSMKQRCYNRNHDAYHNYGGRGIKVCKSWYTDFTKFYEWSMANGYKEGLTIDRIDNDRGYAPWNCRWTTMKIQSNNRRTNKNYKG